MTGKALVKRENRALALAALPHQPDEYQPSLRGLVLAGVAALAVGFGGFGAWAMTARLDNAAVASGIVAVDSKRKTVSHLEGGVLKMMLKTEGERVAKDEPLLRFEDARARAELQQLQGKRVGILISGGNVDIARFSALLV